jgi:RHS repeat-associated protein
VNRLTQETIADSVNGNYQAQYSYDRVGIRTQKATSNDTIDYLVDHNRDYAQVLQELDTNAQLQVQYTYGSDLIGQQRQGQNTYYHYDGLGSTRALTDQNGNETDAYDYTAFGEALNTTGTTENDYLYTGEQWDDYLGQQYLRARYYDPSSARFTQMDVYQGSRFDPITLNKYLYANSDSVNGIDPSGYMTIRSLTTGIRIHAKNAGQAVASYSRVLKTVKWGDVRKQLGDEVKGQLTEQAFGLLGEQIVTAMSDAVQGAILKSSDNAATSGTKIHRFLEEIIKSRKDDIEDKLNRHGADISIAAEVFFDEKRKPAQRQDEGAMGLDVIVRSNITGKIVLGFDLKTGVTGTRKVKAQEYIRRHRGAPVIDLHVRRTK